MPVHARERIQRSKLVRPAPGAWELPRAGLMKRLDDGLSAPLSLICGMAGSGKTTVARQWAAAHADRAVWITLDKSDDDLARFVQLLVAAVRTRDADFGNATLGDLAVGNEIAPEDLAITFGDEVLALGHPILIVLDDFYVIASTEIIDFLEWLFRFAPPGLHVCFVSRTDPPLPLVRYRARHLLAEIRLALLLLTRDEARTYLVDITGFDLSADAVDRIYQQTEGWITGLHLTAVALRDARNGMHEAAAASRASADAIAFLAEEMVTGESEETLRQLWLLAIPERINAELSGHLLESPNPVDMHSLLRTLEANGYFLTSFGDDHTWYRFHPLFREALLASTRQHFGADALRRGHLWAAEWFGQHRFIDQAIRHFLAADAIDNAADLVEANAQRALATDNWQSLEWWLRELPAEVRAQRIELLLAQGWILQFRGAFREIPAAVAEVRHRLVAQRSALSAADIAAYEAEIDLMESMLLSVEHESDRLRVVGAHGWDMLAPRNRACAYIGLYYLMSSDIAEGRWNDAYRFLESAALEQRTHQDDFALVRELWALTFIGVAKRWHGELADALELGERVLAVARANGFERHAAHAHYLIGTVAYEQNDLERAIAHLSACFNEPQTGMLFRSEAAHELARAANLAGNNLLADMTIKRMTDLIHTVGGSATSVHLLRADLERERGAPGAALAWAHAGPVDPTSGLLATVTVPALLKARILLSGLPGEVGPESLATARMLLGTLEQRLETKHVHRLWIAVRVLQAVALDLDGCGAGALVLLSETLDRAEGHVRSFLDQGPAFERLFARLVVRDGLSGFRTVVQRALHEQRARQATQSPVSPAAIRSPDTVEALSPRELEILGYLVDRRSNREIAESLGISPLTVKRHTINLYAKLGVRSRREAVQLSLNPVAGS